MGHGRRRGFHLFLFLSLLILYSVNIWIVADDRPWRSPIRDPLAEDEEWVGAVHIHTRYSDGGGTIDEVASIAADAGLDFVIISDHNTLDGRRDAGYRHGVLVVVATEESVPEGHLVVAGVPSVIKDSAMYVARRASEDGGFSWVAHPFGRPSWGAPVYENIGGIEIVNADSEWRDESILKLLSSIAALPVLPQAPWNRLTQRPDRNFALFDSLSACRRVFFVGSVDAHSRLKLNKSGSFHLAFPSYKSLFRGIRTHVLMKEPPTGDWEQDSRILLASIRDGRTFVGYDGFGDSRSFRFTARNDGREAGPGESLVAEQAELQVRIPIPGKTKIQIYRNGDLWKEGKGPRMTTSAGPGIYRVEVYQERRSFRPWIYTNPVYLDEPGLSGRNR